MIKLYIQIIYVRFVYPIFSFTFATCFYDILTGGYTNHIDISFCNEYFYIKVSHLSFSVFYDFSKSLLHVLPTIHFDSMIFLKYLRENMKCLRNDKKFKHSLIKSYS